MPERVAVSAAATPSAGGRERPLASAGRESGAGAGLGARRGWALAAELSAGCCERGAGRLPVAGRAAAPGARRRAVCACLLPSVAPPPCRSSPSSLTNSLPCFSPAPRASALWMLAASCCDRRMCVCPGPRRIGRYLAPVLLERRARGPDGTRGRDCQAGPRPRAETWPQGRIDGSARVECFLFLLPPSPPTG